MKGTMRGGCYVKRERNAKDDIYGGSGMRRILNRYKTSISMINNQREEKIEILRYNNCTSKMPQRRRRIATTMQGGPQEYRW